MAETYTAFVWIRSEAAADSQLVAAASGGIYQGMAPLGVISPFMSYNRQAGDDVNTANEIRLYASILMQIKMVGPSSTMDILNAGALRIDALFSNRRNVGFSQGGVLSCYREQEVAYEDPKPINGVQWSHLGGFYRISLQGV